MNRIVVVAPHPDDESLGVGGTLLLHRDAGHPLHWLIVTEMQTDGGFTIDRIRDRRDEIDQVRQQYGFEAVHELRFGAARLDQTPRAQLVQALAAVFEAVHPDTVYLPHPGDAHTDHRDTFEASLAALKSFRAEYVERILCYETVSETDANPLPVQPFRATTYVDIARTLDEKLEILRIYRGEMGEHPFPRSEESVRALAAMRGAQVSVSAAEAFMVIRERRRIS